ncbi:MAG: hypothetical protein U1E76_03840 [Planctomycetota bacterium]
MTDSFVVGDIARRDANAAAEITHPDHRLGLAGLLSTSSAVQESDGLFPAHILPLVVGA